MRFSVTYAAEIMTKDGLIGKVLSSENVEVEVISNAASIERIKKHFFQLSSTNRNTYTIMDALESKGDIFNDKAPR
ncbi:hypothetical protein IB691_06030 [Fangia hongkongensis]|nr:hypothetical protein [Fangia hongkongensis]